jgi:hypothetical protein
MKRYLKAWLMLLLAVGFGVGGCGGKQANPNKGLSDDEIAIDKVIMGLQDADPPGSIDKFAKGSKLSNTQLMEYKKYYYEAQIPINVQGDQANLSVKLRDENGKETIKQWTLVKEANKWKLKDAPLN